jgi:hypothetical protein
MRSAFDPASIGFDHPSFYPPITLWRSKRRLGPWEARLGFARKGRGKGGNHLVMPDCVLRVASRGLSTREQCRGSHAGAGLQYQLPDRQRCPGIRWRRSGAVCRALVRGRTTALAGETARPRATDRADTVQTHVDVMRRNADLCCISRTRPHDGKSREGVFARNLAATFTAYLLEERARGTRR